MVDDGRLVSVPAFNDAVQTVLVFGEDMTAKQKTVYRPRHISKHFVKLPNVEKVEIHACTGGGEV